MNQPTDQQNTAPPTTAPHPRTIAIILGATILTAVGLTSGAALAVVLCEGLIAAAIVLAATGLGLWIMRAIGLGNAHLRWQLLGGAGLGLGVISLLMLGLGTMGILHRGVWLCALAACTILGIARVRTILKTPIPNSPGLPSPDPTNPANNRLYWLWLGVLIAGALAILAATMPPGILWPNEANGYDVLEYHLGAPQEYFDAGRISYLPHNIYSNFPFNIEMLYLLAIVLHGNAVAAIFTAKMLNVLLAALAVGGTWLAARDAGRECGVIAGTLAATCPFLAYLCGVAYVENGMLFFSAMAIAATLKTGNPHARQQAGKWALLAGIFSGLACGCKYTAIPMLFLPLGLIIAWRCLRRSPRHLGPIVLFATGCLVMLSPWLTKNTIATGNPVFPLARDVFPEKPGIWDDDCAARWEAGHLPAPTDRTITGRLDRLWNEVLASTLYGPMIALALLAGLTSLILRARNNSTTPNNTREPPDNLTPTIPCCCVMTLVILLSWTGWTHLVGRFAVILMVPAALILGCLWQHLKTPRRRLIGVLLVAGLMAFNTATTIRFCTEHPYYKVDVFGDNDLFPSGRWPYAPQIAAINNVATPTSRVLMVGDARPFYLKPEVDYCVVFNRNPFAEAAEQLSENDLFAWLRQRDYGYVYVDWGEMFRFQSTEYGFWKHINKDLFKRLTDAGLTRVTGFQRESESAEYGTLFRVPAP